MTSETDYESCDRDRDEPDAGSPRYGTPTGIKRPVAHCLFVLLAAALLGVGCGPRTGSGAVSAEAGGGTWRVVAGQGTAGAALQYPAAVALDASGDLYVTDSRSNRIHRLSPDGVVLGLWGSGGPGPGQFDRPSGVAVDAEGNVYVADTFRHRIQKLSATGEPLADWGSEGAGRRQFSYPTYVAVDAVGQIYVSDSRNHRVLKLSPGGGAAGAVGDAGHWSRPVRLARGARPGRGGPGLRRGPGQRSHPEALAQRPATGSVGQPRQWPR